MEPTNRPVIAFCVIGALLFSLAGYFSGNRAGHDKCFREDVLPQTELLNKFAVRGWGAENVDQLPSPKEAAFNAPHMKALVAIDGEKVVRQEVVSRKDFDAFWGIENGKMNACRFVSNQKEKPVSSHYSDLWTIDYEQFEGFRWGTQVRDTTRFIKDLPTDTRILGITSTTVGQDVKFTIFYAAPRKKILPLRK